MEKLVCPHCSWEVLDKITGNIHSIDNHIYVGYTCTNCTYAFYVDIDSSGPIRYHEMLDDPETGGSFLE